MSNRRKMPKNQGTGFSSFPERSAQMTAKEKRRAIKIFTWIAAISVLCVLFCYAIWTNILVGTWRYDPYTAYEFRMGGSGCLYVANARYVYTYKITDDILALDFEEESIHDCAYTFRVDGNKLTLIGGYGTDKGTYTLIKE